MIITIQEGQTGQIASDRSHRIKPVRSRLTGQIALNPARKNSGPPTLGGGHSRSSRTPDTQFSPRIDSRHTPAQKPSIPPLNSARFPAIKLKNPLPENLEIAPKNSKILSTPTFPILVTPPRARRSPGGSRRRLPSSRRGAQRREPLPAVAGLLLSAHHRLLRRSPSHGLGPSFGLCRSSPADSAHPALPSPAEAIRPVPLRLGFSPEPATRFARRFGPASAPSPARPPSAQLPRVRPNPRARPRPPHARPNSPAQRPPLLQPIRTVQTARSGLNAWFLVTYMGLNS
ncbi:hypothetical protein CRG98_013571 [Punica granatum]|uniref:Uncharacterized protein n=1 Tax=Punica granatum TaxID=22663 RepID=A0A2I0KE81_PUNGR|nr:hypothetical protein CRG98_013571 [Punica granatum]